MQPLAFVVPPGSSWPLPLYELALMLAERAYEMCAAVELHVVTPEPTPLELFGAEASREVAGLLARGRHRAARRHRAPKIARHRPVALGAGRRAARGRPHRHAAAARRARPSRACPPTPRASWSSTPTPACRACRTSTPPATSRRSRSSRAGSPASRPTPPRPTSPPRRRGGASRSRSSRSCAGCC